MNRETLSRRDVVPIGMILASMSLIGGVANLSHVITKSHFKDEAEQRVAEVQTHNQQLEATLLSDGWAVRSLTLDDQRDNFRFQSTSAAGDRLSCTGRYAVRDDRAIALGKLSCMSQHTVR